MSPSMRNPHRTATASFHKLILAAAQVTLFVGSTTLAGAADPPMAYRILATSRTSTMEKELNDAPHSGHCFSKVMGGRTGSDGFQLVGFTAGLTSSTEHHLRSSVFIRGRHCFC